MLVKDVDHTTLKYIEKCKQENVNPLNHNLCCEGVTNISTKSVAMYIIVNDNEFDYSI